MKILQLCRKFPYPLKDGESIAVNYLAKAYRDLGAELTLLSFNTIKHFCEVEKLPPTYDHYQAIYTAYLDNYPEPIGAFLNLFSKKSYHISRFETEDFKTKLITILNKDAFDIVQLESVYLAPYIPIIRKLSDAKVVMRAHNVEFEIWERVAQNTSFLPKKWYLSYLVKKLKRYEIAQSNNYDLLLTMTKKDLDYFIKLGFKGDRLVTPIGLQLSEYQLIEHKEVADSISFIGSLDWVPNQEGLVWFIEKIWPSLKAAKSDLTLHIAGRNTPDWLFQKATTDIKVHGEIPDAKAFLLAHPLTIVPLFSGSGMRVKILEGMALGRIVLTTKLGLEGIPAKDGVEVLIADTKEEFLKKIKWILSHPSKQKEMQQNARQFIAQHYDNKAIAKNVLEKF